MSAPSEIDEVPRVELKRVWIPDAKEGYLAGWVEREEGDIAEVILETGRERRRVPLHALFKMNPPKFDRVEDIADLTFLNEASVVHNLRLRYGSGAIYTYSGLFLVAVNPYQSLPLYTDAIIQQYRGKRRDENPPHIFAVAERAWINMGDERENQSILITGESGAGKTESTKKVIQYLAAIATEVHPPTHSRTPTLSGPGAIPTMPAIGLPRSTSMRRGHSHTMSTSSSNPQIATKGRLGLLERQILQANPILEAFGNAQTQRNNNSSRFGKFVRIMFAPDGSIAGANIDWYLLEKSRVVVRSEAERSFHIFYQIYAADDMLKGQLLLAGGTEDYGYLNKSRREVEGIDDREEWYAMKAALNVVGFNETEQFDLFRIIASILHIGNIQIASTRGDDAIMPDPAQAERICYLLGLPIADFTRAILRPRTLAGREWVTQTRTQRQALEELGALCKTLYEKLFGSLVDRINRALDRPTSKSTFIGVLDIAGFEIFEINAYEQLLINFTNEKLQQFFNHHMFVLEQEEYTREGIKWDYVNFGLDLQPTIDLIEISGSVIGILSCLDEECIMPKATDLTFTNKLHHLWAGNSDAGDEQSQHLGRSKYGRSRFDQGFLVQHYAAKVEYRTDGWLEKNKDPLNDDLAKVMAASSEPFVASLFQDYGDTVPTYGARQSAFAKKRGIKKGAFRTVAQRHKEQLASLMAQLQATQPHFVRCIVPNALKKPLRIDVPLVLDQLRCNGVLEGIRIARLGYPNRLPFVEFRQRYEVLTPGIIPRGYMDGREACRRMVNALELDDVTFKIGTSKIFFKAGVLAELEELRDKLLFDVFSKFQAAARMWSSRRHMKKILNRAVAIRTIQRNARVYGELREWPWWKLYTKVRPLLAATRNDEELRKRDVELAVIRERAERDKKEREALQNLKMTLESEKKKIEDALEAERQLALDKDSLLERSKRREGELMEELRSLHEDYEALEAKLQEVLSLQQRNDQQKSGLQTAFDEASNDLARLDAEQASWKAREEELTEQLSASNNEIEALHADLDKLHQDGEVLRSSGLQDIARLRERMETSSREYEERLSAEIRNKEQLKERIDQSEQNNRQVREQLSELTRTATEYSTMLRKKEDQIVKLNERIDTFRSDSDGSARQMVGLQRRVDSLVLELSEEKQEREQESSSRLKLQQELDELRVLMETKTSEETRRLEVEKGKEVELVALRAQHAGISRKLADERHVALELQAKLRSDLDETARQLQSLKREHDTLSNQDQTRQTQLAEFKSSLSELERLKRSAESELNALRSRQAEELKEMNETVRRKESLERQLAASQTKTLELEDAILQLERDQESHTRQIETLRTQLEGESSKRMQYEKAISAYKMDVALVKDHNARLEKELKKTLDDLKSREWEVRQLESRQDKTIVEHVHVLEEAKRVTDRQLQETQLELQKNQGYIRSLEKVKSRLTGETEDALRLIERERLELRAREKFMKAQEEKLSAARVDAHKAKDVAELQAHRLQSEVQQLQQQNAELSHTLDQTVKTKNRLEGELEVLVNEIDVPNVPPSARNEYEKRIAELENQLMDSENRAAVSAAHSLSDLMRQQRISLRQLLTNGIADADLSQQLHQGLDAAEDELERETEAIMHQLRSKPNHQILATPSKSKPKHQLNPDTPKRSRSPDRQVAALQQHVQNLDVQMSASDRVRQHLETSLRTLSTELDHGDGSKQFLLQYRSKVAEDNARLGKLLNEEAKARRMVETGPTDNIQGVWRKFKDTIDSERENYARLEESRKALLIQQRASQEEIEAQRNQLRELTQSRQQLSVEVLQLREQLEREQTSSRDTRQNLEQRLQNEKVQASTSSSTLNELRTTLEAHQARERAYQERLDAVELDRETAAQAEATALRRATELEALREAAEKRAFTIEQGLRESEERLEVEAQLRRDLAEELEVERQEHLKALNDRDFSGDQVQKRYQAQFDQMTQGLRSQQEEFTRQREENRKFKSELDRVQRQYDDEVRQNTGWKSEKDRLEGTISDLHKAYDASTAAQTDQQNQILALHAQVRELREVLDDAEADRVELQRARRALQAQLDTLRLDHAE
ncbi:hypothetical protein BDN72DRAFT_390460 [Pluteus cervinus]|uniref:Uncharacterized protein n=1 Tax=Pluteus cervinus TaxID=181527 RepID=A0ACD3A9Y9_9AGAR|nr:hypothetical protein BDN72DRAFT_390460 [Pluteus cervinus]